MQKNIIIFDKEQYDGEWPPENAEACVAWFAEKVAQIPEEHRANATIDFDGVGGYEGSSYAHIVIQYTRPETAEEIAAREAENRRREEAVKASELRQLAELKAKYGQ